MSSTTNEERRGRILELLEDDELSPYDLDTQIMEEFDCSRNAARKARKRILVSASKDTVENVGDEKDKVTMNFVTREYEFKFYRRIDGFVTLEDEFSIPFNEMADYVVWFVRQGQNMTRKEVCRDAYLFHDRKLTHDYMRRVMKAVDVQKGTTPVAPHQYEEKTQDELLESWHGRDEALLEAKYYATEQRRLKQRLVKKTKELAQLKDFINDVVEEAEFSGLPKLSVPSGPLIKIGGGDIYTDLLLSDWHYGEEIDEWYNTFNAEIAELRVEELLQKFAEYWGRNGKRVKELTIPTLGDMVDGLLANMRPGQHHEQDRHGVLQAVGAADLIASAYRGVGKIAGKKLTTIRQVVGNHGRVGAHRSEDPQRIGETLVYMLANEKSGLKDVEFVINPDRPVLEFQRGRYQYILGHGDKKPRNAKQLSVPRAKLGRQVIHYCGHLHEVELSGIFSSNFTQVQNGALCGSDSYACDQLGYHSTPGQMVVEIGDEGVVLKPIFLTGYGSED